MTTPNECPGCGAERIPGFARWDCGSRPDCDPSYQCLRTQRDRLQSELTSLRRAHAIIADQRDELVRENPILRMEVVRVRLENESLRKDMALGYEEVPLADLVDWDGPQLYKQRTE